MTGRSQAALHPRTLDELRQTLAVANASGQKVPPVQLDGLNRLVEHAPEDMTATVEAGLTLGAFQSQLASRRQWLPVDPPNADRLTLGELLSANESGPRRFGYGTVRDYVIGMKIVLADGRLIKSGGKVVKNVAGYDLCKLFIGSQGTLGVIVEATFKLRPIPETEQFVQVEFDSLEKADRFLQSVLGPELIPVVLDLHNLSMNRSPSPLPSPPVGERVSEGRVRGDSDRYMVPMHSESKLPSSEGPGMGSNAFTVVLGFAGPREDVEDQLRKACHLGAGTPSNLDYDREFWKTEAPGPVRRISVLPSETVRHIQALGNVPFLARAGNGAIWYRGGPEPPRAELPLKLIRRVKDAFDPNHIFPDLSR